MPSIDILTARISGRLGIDEAAARDALETYAAQVADHDGRELDLDDLTDDDAAFLEGAVAAAQRAGDLGDRELDILADTVTALDTAEAAAEAARHDRDQAVRAAISAGARIVDITAITGLSRNRVYQIRDRR
ncbi:hypothetical protein [Corynebacterium sp.]|uniref:hypothetical protein n=1 Tax=Corynebacterium sp. TaxID=1720 RepID=UPI0026DDA38A|nr:hypothetical protein [Corynebacterium sp.]MDO4610940.1 hypothetical protein [Corynebacterium sp.]